MSSTAIDKVAEEILGSGDHDDLQLDYDDAFDILGDDFESPKKVEAKKEEEPAKEEKPIESTPAASISSSTRQLSLLDEPEQLDYEEEIPETGKKRPHEDVEKSESPTEEKDEKEDDKEPEAKVNRRESNEPKRKGGRKCFINPNFKGPLTTPMSINLCRGPFNPNVPPPNMQPMLAPNPNAVTNVVMSALMRPVAAQQPPLGPGMALPPPNFAAPPPMAGPIPGAPFSGGPVPVIPNLNVPPPTMQPNKTAADANWNFMVEAFVRKTHDSGADGYRSRRRSRSSSYSSRSSYSSSSSYSSRSRSRSRSPARRHRRRVSRSPRRDRPRYARDDYRRDRTDRPRDREDRRRDNESPKIEANTKECAEAIGLDEEYLKKIEEQKRLREEIARRKKETRVQTYVKNDSPRQDRQEPSRRQEDRPYRNRQDSNTDDRPRGPRRLDRPPPRDQERERPTRREVTTVTREEPSSRPNKIYINDKFQQKSAPASSANSIGNSSPDAAELKKAKLKAYLAVVVSNVQQLENVYKRISLLATSVGPTKKVWQTSENAMSIIFEKHEHAKQFMLQYHGKTLSGVRLDVTLEKVFLNLGVLP